MKIVRFFCKIALGAFGFKIDFQVPAESERCVMVFAPHTSMWDFVVGKLVLTVLKVKPKFMIRKESFWFPLGLLLKILGGVPVDRKHPAGLPTAMANEIKKRKQIALIIAPEGTRKYTTHWKKGFYVIAQYAQVPVCMCYIDWQKKTSGIFSCAVVPHPDDYEKDLAFIQNHYNGMKGKHSGQFNLEFVQNKVL
ncbi:MAG: 1-acyl-sn-glycerol-3-phosphate acyltransferase [Lentimicrobiaceae bacterium]|nr:1-acyl-sn-glycerol-3-phosphate acyltransferase [Lentimicrobiaceae bacterium]